jgi:hypothetical protein
MFFGNLGLFIDSKEVTKTEIFSVWHSGNRFGAIGTRAYPPPGHSTPRVERRTLDSAEHRDTMLRLVTTRAARHAARAVAPACNVAFQRGYAESGDIVKDVFLNQQKQFRALLDATKDLEVPVNGDRAAIKAYAEKRKAIMQKVRRERNARTETRTERDRRTTGVGDPPVPI